MASPLREHQVLIECYGALHGSCDAMICLKDGMIPQISQMMLKLLVDRGAPERLWKFCWQLWGWSSVLW